MSSTPSRASTPAEASHLFHESTRPASPGYSLAPSTLPSSSSSDSGSASVAVMRRRSVAAAAVGAIPKSGSFSTPSQDTRALVHIPKSNVAPKWRVIFVIMLLINLAGAIYLIVASHQFEVSDTTSRNAERFELAGKALLVDLDYILSQMDAVLQQWRNVVPFVNTMRHFDLIFNRPEFRVDTVWLPRVLHDDRAEFEADSLADLTSFFNNSSGLSPNITEVLFNGTTAVGEEVSGPKSTYYPIRFAAPPIDPSFFLRDRTGPLAIASARTGIIDDAIIAGGATVVGERLLAEDTAVGTINTVSLLAAAAVSPDNASHVLGVMTVSLNWQLFVPEQIALPTPGPVHMRVFDRLASTDRALDGCLTPLLFSGTHNQDGSWTLAPSSEFLECSSADFEFSNELNVSGRDMYVEFTKAPGFDESVDSTQVVLGSVFLVITIIMLLFISGTGWFVVDHMRRSVTAAGEYVEELMEAEQEAREAKEHRDQFLAFLSHELRNPLFGLRGTIDEGVEQASGCGSEPVGSHLHNTFNTLHDCTQQIERTLNTVVNVQNMANGKINLRSAPFRVSSLVDKLRTRVAGHATVRQVELQVSVAPDVPDVLLGDFERIFEAVGHLLRNAVQYSPKLGVVTLRMELQNIAATPAGKRKRLHSVRIGPSPHKYQHEFVTSKPKFADDGRMPLQFVVVDKGPGLKLRQIKRAFQPYTRERIARASQGRGSSLGLPVAQLLCEQMDGFVRARSGVGQGSEFAAVMRLHVADASDLEPVPLASRLGSLKSVPCSVASEHSSVCPPVDVFTFGGRFLAVDDQKINRRLVSRILSKLMPEATVDVAEDGLDAVEKVAAADAAGTPYSCIFMDIQMPRMSGTQATRQLRRNGFSKPIIAVTGGTLEEEVAKYFRAGMVGVIHKPCKKADFEQHIRKHWAEIGGAEQ